MRMFPCDTISSNGETALGKLGMSLLLKTVLGLNNLNLATLLESLSQSEIDECDAQGRTALY